MTGRWRQICILLLAGSLVAGCGVKAPPRPPKRPLPAAVSDLSGSMDGDVLQLTWGIPPEGDDASEATEFAVYRSKTPAAEADCRNCPLTFQHVKQISVTPSDRQAGRMSFSEGLEKGYRYRYKLRTYDAFGAGSDDSNLFSMDY